MADDKAEIEVSLKYGDFQLDVPVCVTRKQAKTLTEGMKVATAIRNAVKALTEETEDSGG